MSAGETDRELTIRLPSLKSLTTPKKWLIRIRGRYYAVLFGVLAAVYLVYSLLATPDKNTLHQYHLTLLSDRIITYSVVIPLVLIWTAGLYGSLKMKGYALLIKSSPDGHALNIISTGLLVLVLSQPLTSDIGILIGRLVKHHASWLPTLTIISNYLNVLLMAAALVLIAAGAEELCQLIGRKITVLEQKLWLLGFILVSTLYSYFLVTEPLHTSLSRRQYYMPDWTILLTIGLPYIYFWYRGFNGAFNLYIYQKKIKGHIYKGSLSFIAAGLAAVIVSSIFIRFLTTISYQVSRLHLTPVLIIIYAFLIITGLGYLLIAWGARKLRKIEEV